MQKKHVAPEYRLEAFNCPHCGAYSTHAWLTSGHLRGAGFGFKFDAHVKDIAVSICQLCGEAAVWVEDLNSLQPIRVAPGSPSNKTNSPSHRAAIVPTEATKGRLVYPSSSAAPLPVDDMPEEIKSDYMEAREIVNSSPRGAAALLRLCVQKLMPILGEKGKAIDDDIAALVQKGLPAEVQQALDSLRVIGNESVHPGAIDLNDDRETALALFDLLNFIVERMITQQKKIGAIYTLLPKSKLDAIAKRDGKT